MNTQDNSASAGSAGLQALTFTLGSETYGVNILSIHEIRCWSAVTRMPQTPPHVLGVLNLRGAIVPIVDLRMRFGLDHAAYTPLTVIIVLSVESASGRRDFGLVVDGVSDVVDIPSDSVKPRPDLDSMDADFVKGIATLSERMVLLLDIDKLIGNDLGLPAMVAAA